MPSVGPRTAPAVIAAGIASATWYKSRERVRVAGTGGYFAVLICLPLAQLALTLLIYRNGHRADLVHYVAVANVVSVFIYNMVFFVGTMLEQERISGTLVSLFVTPATRLTWIAGYVLAGVVEAALVAASLVVFDATVLDVPFRPDYPALLLSVSLFAVSLFGFGVLLSGVGLLVRRTSTLANLVYPLITLLGGVYYPVDALPSVLRQLARLLPFGYGIEAIAGAAVSGRGVAELSGQLVPLAVLAVALAAGGLYGFHRLEMRIRVRGEVDMY
jgi:ABC-2 type transport system permease protein